MKPKDFLISTFAIVMVAALGYLWFAPSGLKQAPDVEVTTLTGSSLRLSELRGHPVLVTFWATTCPGCVQEMPHLVELHKEFSAQGLQVIGVAMPYDPPQQVVQMVKAKKLPYTIALDSMGTVTRAFGDVNLTPTSFLIDPNGRIVHQKLGELDMAKLRDMIMPMLSGQPVAALHY